MGVTPDERAVMIAHRDAAKAAKRQADALEKIAAQTERIADHLEEIAEEIAPAGMLRTMMPVRRLLEALERLAARDGGRG